MALGVFGRFVDSRSEFYSWIFNIVYAKKTKLMALLSLRLPPSPHPWNTCGLIKVEFKATLNWLKLGLENSRTLYSTISGNLELIMSLGYAKLAISRVALFSPWQNCRLSSRRAKAEAEKAVPDTDNFIGFRFCGHSSLRHSSPT